jgi:hypothetical protein
MEWLGHEWTLLDRRLFTRKLVLLVVFFAGFLVLKAYELQVGLFYYGLFLLALHVYILFVFLWRVQWRILAEDRRAFSVRLVAIAVFVLLLTLIKFDVGFWQLLLVVGASLAVHTALLLSLTVDVRPATRPTDALPNAN